MSRIPKIILPLLLAAAAFPVLCGCAGGNTASAIKERVLTGDKGEIHLRDDPVIHFFLNREANSASETAVRAAFTRWSEATHFGFVYAGRGKAGLRRDGKNTVSFLVKWPEKVPMSKIAYCKNWYNLKGRIIESDIIFNMSIARFTTLLTNTPDSYYIEGVMAHEIGHMIGLGHIDSETSLMKPLSTMDESYFMGIIDEETLKQYRSLYPEARRSAEGRQNGAQ